MMENNYQADGWLGFIVGAKLWIDFKDLTNIEKSLVDLNNEIKRQGFVPYNQIKGTLKLSSVDYLNTFL